MVLCDWEIKDEVNERDLIHPFIDTNLQPCSYDVTFDITKGYICPPVQRKYDKCETNGRSIIILPNTLTLISTKEYVKIPNGLVARVEGKSSLGRIGLFVHITAGFIDTGFEGNITLEVVNMNNYPIELEDGCPIGQLVFSRTNMGSSRLYNEKDNHYQKQNTVKASRYEETFDGVYHIEKG